MSRRHLTAILLTGALAAMAVALGACGSDSSSDGPQSFLVRDASGALFVEWDRVGNDVTGSMLATNVAQPEAGPFSSTAQTGERVQQQTTSFTGTVRGESVRLQVGSGTLVSRFNGRLQGDVLELKIPQNAGIQTMRLKPAARAEYEQAATELKAAQ